VSRKKSGQGKASLRGRTDFEAGWDEGGNSEEETQKEKLSQESN